MSYSDMKNVDGLLRANLDRVERQELVEVSDTLATSLSDIAHWATELLNNQTVPRDVDGSPDTHYVAEIVTLRDLLHESQVCSNRRQREYFMSAVNSMD